MENEEGGKDKEKEKEVEENDDGNQTAGGNPSNPLASSGNFFENERDRLAQISLPTPGARELISSDKKTFKQKALNKPSKHIQSDKRELVMTKELKKLEKPTKEPKETKKQKVLLVEDNESVRKVMSILLKNLGYVDIITGENGEEGVKLFQDEKPDIILLDLFMPVMDGGECCAQIRKLPGGANVPIIGVTAHDDPKEIGEFLDNGMNGVLTKPVKKNQLDRVMNRFVGDAAGQAVYTKDNWRAVVSKKQPVPEKAKVLVVEDNKLIQKVMENLLKRLKFQQISFCSNGTEAIAAVRETPFDIIFMDLYMPEMDGVEATAEIRKHGTGANIPIIACTGHAIESDTMLCVRYGMNDLILKPVKQKALVTILRRYGFSVSVPKKKQRRAPQGGPVAGLLRESSLANMTGVQRVKAISTNDFQNIQASHVQREDSQEGLPLINSCDDNDIGRFRAVSQASFPLVDALKEEEEKIDLTGVCLTKMVPIGDLDEDEANTMTFTPGDDIRSVFRKHSSIFIEGALEGGGEWEGEEGELGGAVGRVGGFGEGEKGDEIVPFSLKNIMQRNDLDKGSKLNMMWNDYLLTEGSFAGGDLSDQEGEEGEEFE